MKKLMDIFKILENKGYKRIRYPAISSMVWAYQKGKTVVLVYEDGSTKVKKLST